MYTEEDAKEKACCAGMGMSPSPSCVGSTCMAWRWGVAVKMESKHPEKRVELVRVGYCGLAGPPVNYD